MPRGDEPNRLDRSRQFFVQSSRSAQPPHLCCGTSERPPPSRHVRPQVAHLLDAIGHRPQRERSGRDGAAFDLCPCAWRRHRRSGLRAHGVRGGERRAIAVAPGIDQNAVPSIGFAEFLRQAPRIPLHENRAHFVREPGDLAGVRFAVERETMWKPFEPEVLTQLGSPSSFRRSRRPSAAARSVSGSSSRDGSRSKTHTSG